MIVLIDEINRGKNKYKKRGIKLIVVRWWNWDERKRLRLSYKTNGIEIHRLCSCLWLGGKGIVLMIKIGKLYVKCVSVGVILCFNEMNETIIIG